MRWQNPPPLLYHILYQNSSDMLLKFYSILFAFYSILFSVGKVFALHSERGDIIWKRFYPNCKNQDLYVTRTCAHYPPEAVVLCSQKVDLLSGYSHISQYIRSSTNKPNYCNNIYSIFNHVGSNSIKLDSTANWRRKSKGFNRCHSTDDTSLSGRINIFQSIPFYLF